MSRVRRFFDPPRLARAFAAAAALAIAPLASATNSPSPVTEVSITLSFRALAARPILIGAAPRFLEIRCRPRPVSKVEAQPRSTAWASLSRMIDHKIDGRPSLARESREVARSAISFDSGARVGCRFGDAVPYARIDVRSFAPRDGAFAERDHLGGAGSLLRALGVRFDLDDRTELQFEASLGDPDLGGAGTRIDGADRSLGVAIRLSLTF